MTTSHHNLLMLSCSAISEIWYVDNSFQITDGQPSTLPPKIGKDGDTWGITIDCGRSGSSSIAEGFYNAVPSNLNLYVDPSYCQYYPNNRPQSLNFYFALQVFFGTRGNLKLWVAQGSYDLTNYWWLGGSQVLNSCPSGSVSAFLVPSNDVYVVTTDPTKVYAFDVSLLQ